MREPARAALPPAVTVGAALTIAACLLVFFRLLPLGIPGQWQWPYWHPGTTVTPSPLTVVIAGLLGALAFMVLRATGRRPLRRWESLAALACVFVLHAALLLALLPQVAPQGMPPLPPGVRMGQLVASPGSFAYYGAALNASDAASLLADHEQTMADPSTPERIRTHPPGPPLVFLGVLWLLDSIPYSATRALEAVLRLGRFTGIALPAAVEGPLTLGLSPHEALGAVVCGYVTALLGALAVIGVFLLANEVGGWRVGFATACVYAVTPSANVFVPAVDPWITGLTALCLWLTVVAARKRSFWVAAAAGAVFWLALQISFGAIALLVLCGLTILLLIQPPGDGPGGRFLWPRIRLSVALFGVFVGVAVGLCLLAWGLTSYNAFHAFRLSRMAHAEITARRDYWPWLVMNLLDFLLAFGVCAAVCLIAAARVVFADLAASFGRTATKAGPAVFLVALATLLLLDVSGTVRGEVARIWQFLIPPLLIAPLAWLERASDRFPLAVAIVIASQFVLTLLLQTRVVFMFPW